MSGLSGFILRRIGFGLVTLLAISLLVFLGVEALPGDLAQAILGQASTPETLAAFRKQLGLDLPAHIRYLHWIWGVLQGDFGTSLGNGRPIAELLSERLWNTFFLASVSALIAMPVAVILGLVSALYYERPADRSLSLVALVLISFPEFFVGYILIAVLSIQLDLLPAVSIGSPDISLGERLKDIALPALTLTFSVVAYVMRMTRAAVVSVLSKAYIEMAHLKGITPSRVILRHALPNALSPIINVVVLNLAYLVVGVVVVEVVFAYPGLGQLLVDAVSKRDLPVVQVCCLIFASTYVLLKHRANVTIAVANTWPAATAYLLLGTSSSFSALLGQPLPLPLPPAGNLWVDVDPAFFLPVQADAIGCASLTFDVPADTALRGLRAYVQFASTDPGAIGGVVLSDALEFTILP